MTNETIFDFLRGGRTIPIISNANVTENEDGNELGKEEDLEKESWILYTLDPESKTCPLDCLIIFVRLKK